MKSNLRSARLWMKLSSKPIACSRERFATSSWPELKEGAVGFEPGKDSKIPDREKQDRFEVNTSARSAGFQPAVSPISNRQGGFFPRSGLQARSPAIQQAGNLRY